MSNYQEMLFDAIRENNLLDAAILVQQMKESGMLEEKGYYNRTCLNYAVEQGYIEIVEMLLEAGADVNAIGKQGYTPIAEAYVREYFDIADLLLTHGADINKKSDGGSTLLSHLRVHGHGMSLIPILLEKGIDINAMDDRGWTPLMTAIHAGSIGFAKVLVESGADVDVSVTDEYGKKVSAFTLANKFNQAKLVLLLKAHRKIHA